MSNVYVAEYANKRIRRIDSSGIIKTIAGSTSVLDTVSTEAGNGGPATSAVLHETANVWIDSVGNVFMTSLYGSSLRVIGTDGIINSRATVSLPIALWGDSVGYVYVAVQDVCNIYKFSGSTGSRSTVAGSGTCGYVGDGVKATSTQVQASGLFVDTLGNIYLSDDTNNRIRKVDASSSIISTISGTGSAAYDSDGKALSSSSLYAPFALFIDSAGVLFMVENQLRVRSVQGGAVYTIAGSTTSGYSSPSGSAATSAIFTLVRSVISNTAGAVYISDWAYNRIMLLTNSNPTVAPTVIPSVIPTIGPSIVPTVLPTVVPTTLNPTVGPSRIPTFTPVVSPAIYSISLFAGKGTYSFCGDGGKATAACLAKPEKIFVDSMANVFFAEYDDKKIRKVDTVSNIITTYAGSTSVLDSTDTSTGDGGQATSAALHESHHIWGDSVGKIFVTSYYDFTLRVITADGIITTLAHVNLPYGLWGDALGYVYVSASDTCTIWKISGTTGTATTAAGTGTCGYSGDGVKATSTKVQAYGLFVDPLGSIYFTDIASHRLRKIDQSTSLVTTLSGTGTAAYDTDGNVISSSSLNTPNAIFMDTVGGIFLIENSLRVRSVIGGAFYTIAGSTSSGYSVTSGSTATSATFNSLRSVASNTAGTLYISDGTANRVLMLTNISPTASPSVAPSPMPSVTPSTGPTCCPTVFPSLAPSVAPSKNPTLVPSVGPSTLPSVLPTSTSLPSILPTCLPSALPTIVPTSNPVITFYPTTPTVVPSVGPSLTPSMNPSIGPSLGPTVAPTISPTVTPSVLPSMTPSLIPTLIPSRLPTVSPSALPSMLPSANPSGGPSIMPSFSPSIPSATPTAVPSGVPSTIPTVIPTLSPSLFPSPVPITGPSVAPSLLPSAMPSVVPSVGPTLSPSAVPSMTPSLVPTVLPSVAPTTLPTKLPSDLPSVSPSFIPSVLPTITPVGPSVIPTLAPSVTPSTLLPSSSPVISVAPSVTATNSPTVLPSTRPSASPSTIPSRNPTVCPSVIPSLTPTVKPSVSPTLNPTVSPSFAPSNLPTTGPSVDPSTGPTATPSVIPSQVPIVSPSEVPTAYPSCIPSVNPTVAPTLMPSDIPSMSPTLTPSVAPTLVPTLAPSVLPTELPSVAPSDAPSTNPSLLPSVAPSPLDPSIDPSIFPTLTPTLTPTILPTVLPTKNPTTSPSVVPSRVPSSATPTRSPSVVPTVLPTVISNAPLLTPKPTAPTVSPTRSPSLIPSVKPTQIPSIRPSVKPTRDPTVAPSKKPTNIPSVKPSAFPVVQPTVQPSLSPTTPTLSPSQFAPSVSPLPTLLPTVSSVPTYLPSVTPTEAPSVSPSVLPTSATPSMAPSVEPSLVPTLSPSFTPSVVPTTALPTARPSTIEYYVSHPKATLPSNDSISVVGMEMGQSFKIVIPFLTMSSGASDVSPFSDIELLPGWAGNAYVISGGSPLSTMTIANGVAYTNAVSIDSSKRSVSLLKDVNGDGIDDLIIGNPYAARCYVMFGNDLGYVNMTKGFTIFGELESDLTGWSVSGAGDVNNDTLSDIIVGAPTASGSGAFYVIYGRRANNFDVYLNNLTASQGFAMYGGQKSDFLGISVSNAGDVNKDGCDDIVVGAVMTSLYFAGAAFVVYGGKSVVTTTSSSLFSSSQGFRLTGVAYQYVGYSVSGAGDVNKDGYADVLVGSSPQRSTVETAAYLIYGGPSGSAGLSVSTLTSAQGVRIGGGGAIVSYLGDVNHDGYADMLIGGSYTSVPSAGYIVYTNVTYLTKVTSKPSALPSSVPFFAPTVTPSRIPTRAPLSPTMIPSRTPSLAPSVVPTAPTLTPTQGASQPSSHPSAQPTVPTLPPSDPPTESPSMPPSTEPSERPTCHPTETPSEAPTVRPSREPSELPSIGPSIAPSTLIPTPPLQTRQPVERPTLQPSLTPSGPPALIYYPYLIQGSENVSISSPTEGHMNYIINSSSHVEIDNEWGFNKYTVYAKPGSHLTVVYFNVSTDLFDISDFHNIGSFSDLILKDGSVIIDLTAVQSIHILNLHPVNMSAANFIFHQSTAEDSVESKTVHTLSVVAGVLVALAGLFMIACLSHRVYENNRLKVAALIKQDRSFCMVIKTNIDGSDIIDLEESLRPYSEGDRSRSDGMRSSDMSSFEMSSMSLSTKKSVPVERGESRNDNDEADSMDSISNDEDNEGVEGVKKQTEREEEDSLSSFAVSDFTEDLDLIV